MNTPNTPTDLRLSPRRRRDFPAKHAFTLVELLTVIAIIGVLAAILIPTVGGVRERAKAINCAANLRQTGIAIQTYVSDNKGLLPPVGHSTISPYFTADPRNFQNALLSYLSVAKTTSWDTSTLNGKSYSPTLDCPGYKGLPGESCFSIRQTVVNPDGTTVTNPNGTPLNPWAGIYKVGNQFLVTRPATKLSLVPPGSAALIDRDFSTTAPSHSGFQNALYFDWHVGRVAVNN